MKAIKGKTSNQLRKEFSFLVTKLPTLWTRSYFFATAGNVSSEIIVPIHRRTKRKMITTDKKEKIKDSLIKTREKRKTQKPVTYELKIQAKTNRKKTLLNSVFLESKWLYNYLLFNPEQIKTANKLTEVKIKVKDRFETRMLSHLGSQVKQEIADRLVDNMKSLKNLKLNGNRIGILKPKRFVNSVPLKQYGITYRLDFNRNRVHIQRLDSFRVFGLHQIPDGVEIANANLIRKANGFYLHVTCYINRDEEITAINDKKGRIKLVNNEKFNKPIAIDFGITNKLNLSNGICIDFELKETDRYRRLQRRFSRAKKGSRNRQKINELMRREMLKIVNRRRDCQNKVIGFLKKYKTVVYQDDPVKAWSKLFGSEVHSSGVGTIKSRLSASLETILIDRVEPTTRECFMLGYQEQMSLSDRLFSCSGCGFLADRDWNASLVMLKKGFDVDPDHILSLGWAEVTPVERIASARILGRNPCIRVSYLVEAGSSRIYP